MTISDRAAHSSPLWQRPLTRRTLGLGGLLAAGASLAACGGTSEDAAGGSRSGGADWTPVEVKHAFGTTSVDNRPARVVTVGVTEQDFVLALGIKPVGVTEWYGDQPYASWPWARPALGSAKPTVLDASDAIPFVDVAALLPDLIVGVNSGMTKSDYDKLSGIAPTIAQASTEENYFAPWTVMLEPIATALGKAADGRRVEDSVEAKFAAAAKAHPEFAGKNVIFLQNAVSDGSFIASQKGLGTEFLTALGLSVPADIDRFVREGEQAYIPTEQIRVLDSADVLVWGTEKDSDRAALEKVPGFTDLAAVKAGRSIYTGNTLSGAIYFSSPLSLPYVVEKLTPQIATALA